VLVLGDTLLGLLLPKEDSHVGVMQIVPGRFLNGRHFRLSELIRHDVVRHLGGLPELLTAGGGGFVVPRADL